MKEILIGIPSIGIITALIYLALKYEFVGKIVLFMLLFLVLMFIAYWVGTLVKIVAEEIFGFDSRNDDDPGM